MTIREKLDQKTLKELLKLRFDLSAQAKAAK